MLYRSRGLWATASIKTATIRAFLSFWQNLKIVYAKVHWIFQNLPRNVKNPSNSRRFKGFYLTLLPPFAFFEKRGFQKKNSGILSKAVNTMTEQEKEQILRKMKNREQGDVASNDDDLVRSEKYMKKGQYARSKYKEFYDDVKLSIKEDW